jgi:hypothetical protein
MVTMWRGFEALSSIFLRSFTTKLSTERVVLWAETPQIFYRISSRLTGWPARSCRSRTISTS